MLLTVLVLERTLNYLIKRRLRRIETEERAPTWIELLLRALCRPLCLVIWVYGSYFALSPLFVHFDVPFSANVLKSYSGKVADIGGLFVVAWFIFRVVRLVDLELETRAKSPESKIDYLQASLVGKTLRWVVVIVGSILIIQYVTRIQAGPLIASLGIGGLAVALAAKESIANLFGTVTIVFDRPFKVGDRILIDKHDGFVEAVGYRSTRLRLWNGNLVTIPNEKITNSNVENFARRPHIWWRTDMTITYDTPPEKVDRAVEILKDILQSDEETSAEKPPWVFFDGFNEWSLNLRMTAWFTPHDKEPSQFDYYSWRERNCRQILRRFNQEGIQFAFPTRTTHLANDDQRQLKLMMLRGDAPEFNSDLVER
jgi:MscS family membrane protein